MLSPRLFIAALAAGSSVLVFSQLTAQVGDYDAWYSDWLEGWSASSDPYMSDPYMNESEPAMEGYNYSSGGGDSGGGGDTGGDRQLCPRINNDCQLLHIGDRCHTDATVAIRCVDDNGFPNVVCNLPNGTSCQWGADRGRCENGSCIRVNASSSSSNQASCGRALWGWGSCNMGACANGMTCNATTCTCSSSSTSSSSSSSIADCGWANGWNCTGGNCAAGTACRIKRIGTTDVCGCHPSITTSSSSSSSFTAPCSRINGLCTSNGLGSCPSGYTCGGVVHTNGQPGCGCVPAGY